MLSNVLDRLAVRFARGGQYESQMLRRRFRDRHRIAIGMYSIGAFDRWRIPQGTKIGRYCSVARTARLVEADHPVESLTTHPFLYLPQFGVVATAASPAEPQVIEDDVWLGHNVTILPGCKRIGRGAVVGAGSIVRADVPRYAIMSGDPAKLVRYRFSASVRAAVEASRWWELSKDQLALGLRAVPGFAVRVDVEGVRAFYRAVHGRELPLDTSAQASETSSLPRLAQPELMTLIRQELPAFTEADFDTPIAALPLDSFALINLRVAVEGALGAQVHDAAWGALEQLGDLVGERGSSAALRPLPRDAATEADRAAPQQLAPEQDWAIGPARETTDSTELRRYSINMPQMALKGLSEAWLFKELGDIHWSIVLRSLRTSSAALTDATGARLYATFTRIRLRLDAPLSAFAENDPLMIAMDEQRYGAAMFFGTAQINGAVAGGTADLMTTFSKYGEAGVNTSLLKGTPVLPEHYGVAEHPSLPDLGQEYRALRDKSFAPPLFETEYQQLPPHDINGVGLLYFAAYPSVVEICLVRHAGPDFAFAYSVVERDIMYFANAEPTETLVVRLHEWDRTDEHIGYEASISRKTDGKVMARVTALKRQIG